MTSPPDDLEEKVDLLLENLRYKQKEMEYQTNIEALKKRVGVLEKELSEYKTKDSAPGKLGIFVNYRGKERLNGIPVTIRNNYDGKNQEYLTTSHRLVGPYYNEIMDGYCETGALPAGLYEIIAGYANKKKRAVVTVKGWTLAEIALEEID